MYIINGYPIQGITFEDGILTIQVDNFEVIEREEDDEECTLNVTP